jgi:hypothetical protein
VAEVREARRPLAQGEFERRDRGQFRPEPENLEQLPRRAVSCDDTLTEPVGKQGRFRMISRSKTGHSEGVVCNGRTIGANFEKCP